MRVEGVRANFRDKKVKARIERIRNREVVAGRQLPEPLRESRVRELLVRKVVLPELKKGYGKFFRGLVLIGSAQRKLRKATKSRLESDVDLFVIFNWDLLHSRFGKMRDLAYKSKGIGSYFFYFPKRLSEKLEGRFGIKFNIAPVELDELAKTLVSESWNKEPFQVISGEKPLMAELEKQFSKSANPKMALAENLLQRTTGEYKARPPSERGGNWSG